MKLSENALIWFSSQSANIILQVAYLKIQFINIFRLNHLSTEAMCTGYSSPGTLTIVPKS